MLGILCLAPDFAKHLIRLESLALLGMLGLAACASQGPTDNPVARTGQWFSYLNGDDIRAQCRPGAPERLRLVYNGVWGEQVRTYEVMPEAGGQGAFLETRIFGGIEPQYIRFDDPLGFGRGTTRLARLGADDLAAVRAGLDRAGFARPAPDGQFLWSDNFYWVAMACQNGSFHFNAWADDAPGFRSLALADLLAARDGANTAFNTAATSPRFRDRKGGIQGGRFGDDPGIRFDLQVGENGLRL